MPKVSWNNERTIVCKPRGYWSRTRLRDLFHLQLLINRAENEFLENRRLAAAYEWADLILCLLSPLSDAFK